MDLTPQEKLVLKLSIHATDVAFGYGASLFQARVNNGKYFFSPTTNLKLIEKGLLSKPQGANLYAATQKGKEIESSLDWLKIGTEIFGEQKIPSEYISFVNKIQK